MPVSSEIKFPNCLTVEPVSAPPKSFRFHSNQLDPQQNKYQLIDPKSRIVHGYVVVDDTRRGPGLGGIRIAPDLTLQEVSRLARAMTLKNSAACLPYGGGKAGLIFDPDVLRANGSLKRELVAMVAEALWLVEDYISAPDMGTNEKDIQQIFEVFSEKTGSPKHKRGGAARPPEQGGIPIDNWGLTAHSLFAAIETLESRVEDFQISGSRVVVQGFGSVGYWIAHKLAQAGALIVGASDITAGLYASEGLSFEKLQEAREQGGLFRYSGPLQNRFPTDQLDWLLEAPCELLIPAARPDAITARNVDRIESRFIFQGANAPSSKVTEYYLEKRRTIPSFSDFIVNVGGVMGCAVELEMTADDAYRKKVLQAGHQGRDYIEKLIYNTVSANVQAVLDRQLAEAELIFRETATELAEERLNQPDRVWI